MKKIIALIALGGLLWGADYFKEMADEQKKIALKIFKQYDKNGDNKLSYKEYKKLTDDIQKRTIQKSADEVFKKCDKNKNSKIEINELISRDKIEEIIKSGDNKKFEKTCMLDREFFELVDENRDKVLTKKEYIDYSINIDTNLLKSRNRWIKENSNKKKMIEIFKKRLKNCDSNKDGKLTLIEATSSKCHISSELFLKYAKDYNSSFKISDVKEVIKEDRKAILKYRFTICDKNRDNKLDLIEATSMFCHMPSDKFKKYDSNGDNFVTLTEANRVYEEKFKNIEKPKLKDEMSDDIKESMAFVFCNYNRDEKIDKKEAKECNLSDKIFKKLDLNKNGYLDANDYKEITYRKNFDREDDNSNGYIDPKEFEKMGYSCRVMF